jgi:hypothetical protein
MTQDTNTAYRLRERGLESAPVVDGRIDPKSWAIVDFSTLDAATAKNLRGMMSAIHYAQRTD